MGMFSITPSKSLRWEISTILMGTKIPFSNIIIKSLKTLNLELKIASKMSKAMKTDLYTLKSLYDSDSKIL